MPLVSTPDNTLEFVTAADFERWLSRHHESRTELWIRFHKKGSGLPTVTYKEAVDVALCWGWIDGIARSLDERSYVQRFTPRGKKSLWSQINRDNVARLVSAGRMTPHGLAHVEAAKADGRWDAAYASPKALDVSGELLRAIQASPRARRTLERLDRQSRYAMAFRFTNLKTAAGRQKKIAEFVAMLEEGRGPFGPAPERTASKKPASKKPASKQPAKPKPKQPRATTASARPSSPLPDRRKPR
jgi:uncharacterized protein YdeI (YjbR/CyaY-like superfamily)